MTAKSIRAGCQASLVVFFLLMLPRVAFAAPGDQTTLGIFPVFEMGDSKLGTAFAQHLTTMIYRQLQDSALNPVLLNPGGLYSGSPDAETLDYARSNNVSVALITTLLSTDIPDKGDFLVRVDSKLIDVATGNELASWESTAPVSRHELAAQTAKTYAPGAVGYIPGGATALALAELSGPSSHPFEKTAVGKAAHTIAEDIGNHVTQSAPAGTARTAAAPAAPSCQITFRVSYVAKHASSKSYDIVVNGKDETLSVVDGKVPLNLNSGPVLIQLSVHDSPYKMPKQDVYQTNTRLACSPDQQTLVLELDAAGEGTLKWQE